MITKEQARSLTCLIEHYVDLATDAQTEWITYGQVSEKTWEALGTSKKALDRFVNGLTEESDETTHRKD